MDNKEAISIIAQIKGIITNDNSWSDVAKVAVKEAFELAIKALEERPQVEFAEKLNERIEKSVCKYCQMNKHCELCEISRVFSIIALTDKEMRGGAE